MIKNYTKKGKANVWKGREAVGGTLYAASNQLVHVPHKINIQKEVHRIDFSQIDAVKLFNSLLFVPNGLSIFLKDGSEIKYVLEERKSWKEEIEHHL